MATVFSLLLAVAALSLLSPAAMATATGGFFVTPPIPYQQHLSSAWLLEPILANLGFHELSLAVNGIYDFPTVAHWDGPTTLFAPSDAAVQSCYYCSVPRILAEHIVPGLFSLEELRHLAAHGTKIETMNPGHCIPLSLVGSGDINQTRVFAGNAEITRPNLFNNGLMIIHGLGDHLLSLRSPLSCTPTKTPQSFRDRPATTVTPSPRLVMSVMLRDAMVQLRTGGFAVLALALKERFEDMVALQNATLFAVEDRLVFSDPRNYAGNVWFHIVPNRFLAVEDLAILPEGSTLETMDRGRNLTVTSPAGPSTPLEINGVGIKTPGVVKNARLVAHSIFVPFLHLRSDPSVDGVTDGRGDAAEFNRTGAGSPPPSLSTEGRGCRQEPIPIEDSHGL